MRDRFFWPAFALLLVCIAVLSFAPTRRILPAIEQVEGVARVERLVSPWRATRCVVHVADYHAVDRAALAAALRDQDRNVTDADIEAEYDRIMAKVRRVQANQLRLIRWLAKEHGVDAIFMEGLTDRDKDAYAEMLYLVGMDKLDPARIGAAGQAFLEESIEVVLPAEEDEAAYWAADPLAGQRTALEGPANDRREAAIVRRLARRGPLAVVVLGAGYDLSRHVKKLGGCEYVKVFVDGLEE